MIGIVLVSHSAALAEGLAEMADQIAGGEVCIIAAGGGPDGTLGTRGDVIVDAIAEADSGNGVLILADLGSAILSVKAALASGDVEGRAPCSRTPRSSRARSQQRSRPRLDRTWRRRAARLRRLGVSGSSNGTVSRTVVIPVGVDLHARPAGQLVRAAAAQGVRVVLRSNGREAEAASILQVLALGATGGTEIVVEASGEAAGPAVEAIAALLASLA